MRRAVTLFTLVVVLASGGTALAQEETVLAPAFFDVNGGSVTTPALTAGRKYRLVAGGTFKVVGPNVTFDHDSAYCYGDDSTTPICRGDESLSQTGLWARYGDGQAAPFYGLSPAGAPAYAPDHRYDVTFTAAESAPLTLLANTPELGRDYVGQLGVALYGAASTTPPPPTCRRGFAFAFAAQCSTFVTPDAYKPGTNELVSYRPPPPGETTRKPGPPIAKDATKVTVEVTTSTGQELVAIEGRRSRDAINLCFFVAGHPDFLRAVEGRLDEGFGACVQAVIKVLAHCDALKRERGGPGLCGGPATRVATAAGGAGCVRRTVVLGRGGARVKASCTATPTGVRLTVAKRGRRSLRKAIGKRLGVVIGSPPAGRPVTADDRIDLAYRVRR